MIAPVYVIGHVNPDTDTIAAAMGYAWLLRQRDDRNALAARAGAMNSQTAWVLKATGLEPPPYLADASPRFERIARTLPPILPDRPLREAWAVAAAGNTGAPIVEADGSPLGLVTGHSVFQFFSRQMEERVDLENVSVARILSVPCHEAVDRDVPRFPQHMRVRDGRARVVRDERDDFLITDDEGKYYGICRTPDVLNPPRMQIILVDHNEAGQALGALDEAELVEVLDHHRLGNSPTHMPIPFTVDPVGSTATLVAERAQAVSLKPPVKLAGLLLAGILSDTLVLTSPTTTSRDQIAVGWLAGLALGNAEGALPFADYKAYGEAILAAGAGLALPDVTSVVQNDLKLYESGGMRFSISQVEAANLLEVGGRLPDLTSALEGLCQTRGLVLAVLMVTDVVRGVSRLVVVGETDRLNDLPYTRLPDGTLEAPGVVSRKKQLLPAILGLLE